ncbi:hypothetical protein [Streptomyces sp. ITFR-16]|uniref:hypothetical protein n=1 Tax=Streptomyces sp. ITFR-16 TaxID=3075198 RepID=UPI002889001C|nr:hypothetical protein [Streptomyces sp. ITFR-16]WNI26144.1 hypothetical protein RLT58_31600 [Streptomyces sp. ITFR-16]
MNRTPRTTEVDGRFSPNGRVLAVGGHTIHNGDAGSGGFVDLWSLTSPSHPVLLGLAGGCRARTLR